MLDLKAIRSDPERFRGALARRGAAEQVDELLALDARRRELLPEIEQGRAAQNEATRATKGKKPDSDTLAELRELSNRIKGLQGDLSEVEEKLGELALTLPNLPDPDAPEGDTEEDAAVIREVGERPQFEFAPRDHLEIGTELGLIDMEAGARLSGSRFAYLKGDLVLLELALVRF